MQVLSCDANEVMTGSADSRGIPRYERIGRGYARTRREDPQLARRIHRALGDARTTVNVGAGTGSYEPRDRYVLPIEPSDVMAGQRSSELPPAIRASADELPLRDQSVDAAMAILTVHHWDEAQEAGIHEMRRVARGPVVILTYDPTVSGQMWLMAEYLPEVAELDRLIFPGIKTLQRWLGGTTRVEAVDIPRDTPDWTLGSFWAHPERVLDEAARNATSGFARMKPSVVERVTSAVRDDLESGVWDHRHGYLRQLRTFDAGLRLLINMPADTSPGEHP